MTSPVIVTLDGPAGVGKTTLAKRVAQALGVAYLDTGAMFRALAYALGPAGWDKPEAELRAVLDAAAFSLSGSGAASVLSMNGRVIGEEIRTEEVGMWASHVAKLAAVRDYLKAAQQAVGQASSLVAEGRDMGTVVFPNATRKFFLDARPEVRAERRYQELKAKGQPAVLEEIAAAIRERDEQDRGRAIAPLRPAEDAVIVDTSDLDIDGVFSVILGHLRDLTA